MEARKKEHLYNAFKLNIQTYFYNALRCYGEENFEWSILAVARQERELGELEKNFIQKLNTLAPCGYNLTFGGDGGDTFSNLSEDQQNKKRNKLSLAAQGKKLTPEGIEKIREHMIKDNPAKRKEVREKIKKHHSDCSGKNNSMFGKVQSKETRKLISDRLKGGKASAESKQKMSEKRKKEKNPRARAIICLETGEKFLCIQYAKEKYGPKDFTGALKKGTVAAGFHWAYLS